MKAADGRSLEGGIFPLQAHEGAFITGGEVIGRPSLFGVRLIETPVNQLDPWVYDRETAGDLGGFMLWKPRTGGGGITPDPGNGGDSGGEGPIGEVPPDTRTPSDPPGGGTDGGQKMASLYSSGDTSKSVISGQGSLPPPREIPTWREVFPATTVSGTEGSSKGPDEGGELISEYFFVGTQPPTIQRNGKTYKLKSNTPIKTYMGVNNIPIGSYVYQEVLATMGAAALNAAVSGATNSSASKMGSNKVPWAKIVIDIGGTITVPNPSPDILYVQVGLNPPSVGGPINGPPGGGQVQIKPPPPPTAPPGYEYKTYYVQSFEKSQWFVIYEYHRIISDGSDGGGGGGDGEAGGPNKGVAGTYQVLPTQGTAFDPDKRMEPLKPGRRSVWPDFPEGHFGIVLSVMDENRQVEDYLPTDPRLVAVNYAGDPLCGSLVCDLQAPAKFDPGRTARLHSAFRVILDPKITVGGTSDRAPGGTNVLAIQFSDAGQGDCQGGYAFDRDRVLRWSEFDGGPTHPGELTGDKHQVGTDADGNVINGMHLSELACFYYGKSPSPAPADKSKFIPPLQYAHESYDGPLHFETWWPKGVIDEALGSITGLPGGTRFHEFFRIVHMGWDPAVTYRYPKSGGNILSGKWRWWTRDAWTTYRPPPVREDDPPGRTPPPRTPPPGGGIGPGFPGGPTTPGGGGGGPGTGGPTPTPGGGIGPGPGTGGGGSPGGGLTGGGKNPGIPDMILTPIDDRYIIWSPVGQNIQRGNSLIGHSPMSFRRGLVTMHEAGAPSLTGLAIRYEDGQADTRYEDGIRSPEDVEKFIEGAPATYRISAFAAQGGRVGGPYLDNDDGGTQVAPRGDFTYTQRPGSSRFRGGSASGGAVITPPEVDLTDIDDAFAPTGLTLSETYWIFAPGVSSGWGIPEMAAGKLRNGYSSEVDPASDNLVWSAHDAVGAPTEMMKFTSAGIDMNNKTLINLPTPTDSGDVATKGYVDSSIPVAAPTVDTEVHRELPNGTVSTNSTCTPLEVAEQRTNVFGGGVDQVWYFMGFRPFSLPSGTFKCRVIYKATATGGDIRLAVSISRRNAGIAGGMVTYDTANVAVETVPGTANDIDVVEVTLTNADSLANGGLFHVKFERTGAHGDDTLGGGDVQILGLIFWIDVA